MKNLMESTCVEKSHSIDEMADAELDTKLQHSYEQSLIGKGRSMNEVFDDLERSLK